MRFIGVFLLLWFAVIGLRELSMGNSHTVTQWVAILGTPVAELVVCQYILQVVGKSKKPIRRVMTYGISFFFVAVLTVQYYYYYVSGEFITLLAFENVNQAYLLLDVKFALFGVLVAAVWLWVSKVHMANISSKRGGSHWLPCSWQSCRIRESAYIMFVILNTPLRFISASKFQLIM